MRNSHIIRMDSWLEPSAKKQKHPFHLFLKSFWLFGLDLEGDDKRKNASLLFRVGFKIWTGAAVLFYHYWIAFDIAWYVRHTVHENALAESVTVWSTVLTFDFLIWKRKDVRRLMAVAEKEFRKLNPKQQKRHAKEVLAAFVVAWTYIAVFSGQPFLFTPEKEYSKHHAVSLLGFIAQDSNQVLYFELDAFFESFFIQGLLTMTIALYLLLCSSCRKWFQHLKNRNSPSDIQRFCAAFDALSQHVHLLDDVFSLIVAAWLLMILIILCLRIVSILNPLLLTTNQMIAVTVLSFSRAAIALVGMSFLADSVYNMALRTLFKLDCFYKAAFAVPSAAVYQEIQMAINRFDHRPTQLTFWKVTRLSRQFLMTCIGMMTTYVIISIQVYPNAKKGLESL